jgi:sugar lactone lactonase YvrE
MRLSIKASCELYIEYPVYIKVLASALVMAVLISSSLAILILVRLSFVFFAIDLIKCLCCLSISLPLHYTMKRILFILIVVILSVVEVTAQIIITVAGGTGGGGYYGDGGQATNAGLNGPDGVAFDAVNNMYIADEVNNVIRKVSTSGIISTIAGGGSSIGDGGQATNAQLNNPTEVLFDALGNLYIGDYYNNRIRRVNTAGIITTIAGNGILGFSGDGGQATNAQLNKPTGIVFDAVGNFYIADEGNNRIRKVNTLGVISTVAGDSTQGYSGDGGASNCCRII